MNYKIVNSSLFICDKWGNPGRKISSNVAFGTFDEKSNVFLVTKVDGKLEIKDTDGNLIRNISKDVYEARFLGEDIVIRKQNGKNCIIDRFGNFKRYI